MPNSGLSAMRRAMTQYFEDHEVQAAVLFGLQARGLWARSRVVIIPGHFDGSQVPRPMAGGRMEAPQQKQSLNPRELAGWIREVTLSIFAVDQEFLRDEEAQNTALENLVEATLQATWNAIDPISGKNVGGPGVKYLDTLVLAPPVQQAYGRELLLWTTIQTPFFDIPQQVRVPMPALSKQIVTNLVSP